VPQCVVELNSLGVISESAPRPFKRVQTAPPAVFSSHRSFFAQRAAPARTQSQGLMIFLANNEIKVLPPEFFKLSNLTVLSLRAHLASFFSLHILKFWGRKQQPRRSPSRNRPAAGTQRPRCGQQQPAFPSRRDDNHDPHKSQRPYEPVVPRPSLHDSTSAGRARRHNSCSLSCTTTA
jgi:hypothetical protein